MKVYIKKKKKGRGARGKRINSSEMKKEVMD